MQLNWFQSLSRDAMLFNNAECFEEETTATQFQSLSRDAMLFNSTENDH